MWFSQRSSASLIYLYLCCEKKKEEKKTAAEKSGLFLAVGKVIHCSGAGS